jgi:hypothetical protein
VPGCKLVNLEHRWLVGSDTPDTQKVNVRTSDVSIVAAFCSQDSSASELGSVESVASPTSPQPESHTLATESSSLLLPKKTGPATEAAVRDRAASVGSGLASRRDVAVKENEDLNRTMLFQVG